MCLGLGLLAGGGGAAAGGAAAASAASTGFAAAASAGSALGFGAGASSFLAAAPAISFVPTAAAATAATSASFLGLGAAAKPFLFSSALNLGTNLFQTMQQRSLIFDQARGIYASSLQMIENAEKAKKDQEAAILAIQKEKDTAKKEKIMTAKVQGLQLEGALRATEKSGNTIALLLQDIDNQTANVTEGIETERDGILAQTRMDINGAKATRDNRYNAAKDQITKATNAVNNAPSLFGSVMKSLATSATSYAQLRAA